MKLHLLFLSMAASQDIKGFIAQWLQLGKSVEKIDGSQCFKPERILGYQGFSQEFEAWWSEFEESPQTWALAGSHQPLSKLYAETWEISNCSRCEMPIPIQVAGVNDVDCPCTDLPSWPNLELPQPRIPEDSSDRLRQIRNRLRR